MDTSFIRPITNPKRVKLVSTCDVCKNRKVKCDKERPECGTCKKTNRKCSYEYAALTETMRDKQSGMKSQNDSNYIQSKLNYLQRMQFGQLYDESGYLSMASRGFGIDVNESQHIPGMLAIPMSKAANVYDGPDGTSILTSEVLQYTSNIVSSIQRDTEQQQYDSSYYLNNDDFSALAQQIPEQNLYQPPISIPPQQFQQQLLSPQKSPHQHMPQQPPLQPPQPPHQPPLQESSQQNRQVLSEDTVMEDLMTSIKNMNLYESTRYIGEGSLLMIDDENYGEMIIPEMTKDISEVDDSLKFLPNEETVIQLIKLYYDNVHRYFPAIREQVVWNALGDLSKPQHLLLLNCIFFIASPFHDDPDKKDGRIYFERAEALLYEYCTQPHALTVMSIILLGRHNKQVGSRWMYNGIATKMLFELGLHRKFRNLKIKMDKAVEKLRNEAFWMTFISENLVSATYGRPNMIDETDCDIDVPSTPSVINEKTKLEIAYIYLINLSRICARVRKYIHAASRLRFLVQDDENKFRVLDAALASWFNSLPDWLRFEKIVKDPDRALLNGIGGDIHIFFYTILILLHSRYMKPQPYQHNVNATNSSIICIQSATIIVHWLEILLDKHRNFFKFSISGHLAINPAMRVFSWHVQNENNKKARDMLQRLEIIKSQVGGLSEDHDGGKAERRWLGIEATPHGKVGNHEIHARHWEVFIPDNDKSIRRQYSLIARKQTGGLFMPRKGLRSTGISSTNYMRGVKMNNSGSRYDFTGQQDMQDLNFTFKTDKTFDFSAFSSGQNFNLPQLTVESIGFDETGPLESQDYQHQYHTPSQQSPQSQQYHQQSPQLQPQQFHTPLSQSPQSQSQEEYHSSQFKQHHSPQQKYHSPLESPHFSHEVIDVKPPHIDTNFNNNNSLWTPPQSARPQNTMLTPPADDDEFWYTIQSNNNFGNNDDDSVGLGISVNHQ